MTQTRYRFHEREHPYFLTDTITAWLPVFAQPENAQIVLESWRFLQRERGILIFGWVIMENHLHWIAAGENLPEQAARFKSYTARKVIDRLKASKHEAVLNQLRYFKLPDRSRQEYQLWQQGSHPQQITSDAMMEQKLAYIHNNPVRRGYVDEPAHWRYSSARDYEGQKGLLDVVTDWR
jgi:REP element-mobilizing transposase RayT